MFISFSCARLDVGSVAGDKDVAGEFIHNRSLSCTPMEEADRRRPALGA
jgi:hypothetical protein